jgi:hypothetical protein|tara:strand:+ start:24 stop:455 length:432 start_codon:yes stop_codon:yes gene_type:complete
MKEASLYTELRKEYPRTWRIWYVMNNRIAKKIHSFHDIEIHEEWDRRLYGQEAFLQFLEDMGPCEIDDLDLRRNNCCIGYVPGNVDWQKHENQLLRTRWAQTDRGKLIVKIKSYGHSYMKILMKTQRGQTLEQILKEVQNEND